MRSSPFRVYVLSLTLVLAAGCASSPSELSASLVASTDLQESATLVEQTRKFGGEAIPILLIALDRNVSKKHSVLEIGKTNLCVLELKRLALAGIHRSEEVPILLKVIREQVTVQDTLATAEILKIITSVDPGYDKAFVEHYSEKDEAERILKIQKWENWLNSHQRQTN